MAAKNAVSSPCQSARPRTAAPKRKSAQRAKPVLRTEPVVLTDSEWVTVYSRLFGAAFPKGKVLNAAGDYMASAAGRHEEICLAQYAPKPSRIGWLYVSHGFSLQAERIELCVNLSERNTVLPGQLLMEAGNYLQDAGAPQSGILLSAEDGIKLPRGGFSNWLVCSPAKNFPDVLPLRSGPVRLLLVMGVTDNESAVARRVNPQLANGCEVLLTALKAGGVFPVTDTTRPCMTRQRDFSRLWEHAFRVTRERTR